jgi:hypothetical protein
MSFKIKLSKDNHTLAKGIDNEIQGNGTLVLGAYVDQKLEDDVTVGILGLDRVI